MTKLETAQNEIRAIFANEVECIYETTPQKLQGSRVVVWAREIRLAGMNEAEAVSEEIVESMVRAFMDTADFVVGDGEMEAHNLHAAMRAALRAPSPTREEVARVIDPDAWALADRINGFADPDAANQGRAAIGMPTSHDLVAPSLAKADAILSLFGRAG